MAMGQCERLRRPTGVDRCVGGLEWSMMQLGVRKGGPSLDSVPTRIPRRRKDRRVMMHFNIHSLYTGAIVLILLIFMRANAVFFPVILFVCMLTDFGQLMDRIGSRDAPIRFFIVTLSQSILYSIVFVGFRFLF